MRTVCLKNFIDRVLAELTGNPPVLLVKEELLGAMKEFCRDTWVWNTELMPQSVMANQSTYYIDLDYPKEQMPVKLLSVSLNGQLLKPLGVDQAEDKFGLPLESAYLGTPRFFVQKESEAFILLPKPDASIRNGLNLRVAIAPTMECERVPIVLAETWRDAILSGTLARMCALHGKPWTNGEVSTYHASKFEIAKAEALEWVQKGLTRAPFVTKARWF